jgi:hypothetical protein
MIELSKRTESTAAECPHLASEMWARPPKNLPLSHTQTSFSPQFTLAPTPLAD